MARPRERTASPRLTTVLGEETAKNLLDILGPDATQNLDRELAQLAQLGQLAGLRFQSQLLVCWMRQTEQETARRFDDLQRSIESLADLVTQHTDVVQRDVLNGDAFAVGAREALQRMRAEVRRDRRRRTSPLRQFGRRRLRVISVAAD